MTALPYKLPYHRRSTNKVMSVGMNYLSDLVIRPGIRKRLWPLCLYRGNVSPGHAHRFWNVALLMMAAECQTLADGLKIINNSAFVQLCGTVRAPQKMTLNSFFGRLWDSPDVTDNIPGFTEYVRSLELGPSTLQRIELETYQQFCAPWRVSLHPDFDANAEKPETGIRNLYYPYLAHDPKNEDDGRALVLLANQVVPEWLPEQIRADVCQDLIVGIMAGDVNPERADDFVIGYMRRIYRMFPQLQPQYFGGAQSSFDAPIRTSEGDGIPRTERI